MFRHYFPVGTCEPDKILTVVLDHIGESEVEVLAVSIDGLVGDAEVLHLGLGVQNRGYKLLALLFCPDAA